MNDKIKRAEIYSYQIYKKKMLKDPPALDLNDTIVPYENNAKYSRRKTLV